MCKRFLLDVKFGPVIEVRLHSDASQACPSPGRVKSTLHVLNPNDDRSRHSAERIPPPTPGLFAEQSFRSVASLCET